MNRLSLSLVSFLASAALSACSVTSTGDTGYDPEQATAVSTDEQDTAQAVSEFATSTPPDDATDMGMESSPHAGPVTIPISNVEVYTFSANVDGSDGDETMYWADDDDAVYVWGEIALDCVDDTGASTGETGTADFVYESDSGGYGWMTATDSCGYSTYYGCSADSSDAETCGGCDFTDYYIACSEST